VDAMKIDLYTFDFGIKIIDLKRYKVSCHGHVSKGWSHIAHVRMASSVDVINVEKGKFKMSISKISCLKLAVHLVIMDM
jgi:hypothetical protein